MFDLLLSPSRPFHTFMAMEYIHGPTLKEYITQLGRLAATGTFAIARQLFTALAELHSLGAVHRDVKAANIMVANQQPHPIAVKLVDLGIIAVAAEEKFTVASAFLGSKHSAPLEQLTGGPLDERTDIYGAGSVLFHCMKGSPMYGGVGPEGAIVRQMLATPDQLAESTDGPRDLSAGLAVFINRCIRVDARERPTSARQCLDLLSEITKVMPTPDSRTPTSTSRRDPAPTR